MAKKLSTTSATILTNMRQLPRRLITFWQSSKLYKLIVILVLFFILALGSMYAVAHWYRQSQKDQPLVLGASFIADYAQSLGVDPKLTLDAMLNELDIKHLRLVSYWNKIEANQGSYDFGELDWQFEKANDAGAQVSLAIGLRQPRWPECHMPEWARNQPKAVWSANLQTFVAAVINRYKDNPALQSYQLENEYFLDAFGVCPDHSRERLIAEYQLVKKLDPQTPVILSRSNNTISFPTNEPTPDIFGMSIYRRIWSPLIGGYFNYPLPAWYYSFLAGGGKILTGRDAIIHEMQAEPWAPDGKAVVGTSLAEQNKSLDAAGLQDRFEFGQATGLKRIDLWGAEYWYYRKEVLGDPSVWNVAKQEYCKATSCSEVR